MIYKLTAVLAAVLLIIGGWLTYYYSDTRVIKRQLDTLALELSKQGQEATLQTALKIREIATMLPDSCLVHIPERDFQESVEKDLIIRYLLYQRNRYQTLSVSFVDPVIELPVKGEALVRSMVRLVRKKSEGTEPVEVISNVEIVLGKGEEKWQLRQVILPEILLE